MFNLDYDLTRNKIAVSHIFSLCLVKSLQFCGHRKIAKLCKYYLV